MRTGRITLATLAVTTIVLCALAGCAASRPMPEPATALTASVARGKLLHDTQCIACHDSTIYTRSDRLAKSYADVRQQVDAWQAKAGLLWNVTDIDDVTLYVNDAFYKYECPKRSC